MEKENTSKLDPEVSDQLQMTLIAVQVVESLYTDHKFKIPKQLSSEGIHDNGKSKHCKSKHSDETRRSFKREGA